MTSPFPTAAKMPSMIEMTVEDLKIKVDALWRTCE